MSSIPNPLQWLNTTPTLNVSRSQTVAVAKYRALNVIAAATVNLNTSGLSTNAQLVINNSSSLFQGVVVTCTAALIGGETSVTVTPGNPLCLIFDGTNFEIQS